ncbi:MAG: metallophosphoesterase [Hyphomonadaceae bacterium]|nr:MAG: serine/threonine protein phosphatase 1 [Caulobacteraceae bacterium]MBT9446300.1 metallophosphoesterase [Hyphomonadaceae bacterium]TPW08863.1 MAG: serine/threonine protein phosphatase 1 [Alphaproteobacteria bacterium]
MAQIPLPQWSARMAAGRRVYAIGDIHGRADLLGALLAQIESDIERHVGGDSTATLVFLGDYVDCGLESRACLDRLIALGESARETHFLKGKHDAALLAFLDRPAKGGVWLSKGGRETLFSYGVPGPSPSAGARELARAAEALSAAMPPAHLEFLRSLKLHVRFGDYVFVHAGLKPGVALDAQQERDLLTIREPFLTSRESWPFVVVHGNTPVERLYRDTRRIGVDTGAYATGRLSAVCLDGGEVRLLQT